MDDTLLPHLKVPMDALERSVYEGKFVISFLRAKGETFQTFFETLMSKAYKADFMACRPWGNDGDKKNDGFLQSERRLFQVYAPNEMTKAKAIKKIRADFEGAKPHWGKYYDRWTFAHNAEAGLPWHVQQEILDLQHNNPGIKIEPWCLEEFLVVFRRLDRADLQSWFGFTAPTNQTKNALGFNDLRIVLEAIGAREPAVDYSPEDVPAEKLSFNNLSGWIRTQISEAGSKRTMVGEFFETWPDPIFGEEIAAAFRAKYKDLRDQTQPRHTPDDIYRELLTWAGGGPERGTPQHEMAVITVLAYYFDSCDIFEPQRVVAHDPAH